MLYQVSFTRKLIPCILWWSRFIHHRELQELGDLPATPGLSPHCRLVGLVGSKSITVETIACIYLPTKLGETDSESSKNSYVLKRLETWESKQKWFCYEKLSHIISDKWRRFFSDLSCAICRTHDLVISTKGYRLAMMKIFYLFFWNSSNDENCYQPHMCRIYNG